jgi:hypothetical protein
MTADTYSNTLGVLLMGTGNDNNVWGSNCNSAVFQILEDAIANVLTSAITGGTLDLSGSPPPTAASQVHYAALIFSGTLASNQVVRVPNLTKWWWVKNATSGAFTLSLETYASSVAGTPAVIPQNSGWQLVQCDGGGNIIVSPFNSVQAQMPAGAEGAPSYSFTDDATSGLYLPNTTVTDGAMNGSTAVLTCASSTPFQPGDVGRKIVVAGAGAAGANLVTTIMSWTSNSVVTLTANSQTAVSGATVTYDGLKVALAADGTALGVIVNPRAMAVATISSIASGGTGYAVNDLVTGTGGTALRNFVAEVTTVSAGVITAASIYDAGVYDKVTGTALSQGSTTGVGTGAQFNVTWTTTNEITSHAGASLLTALGLSSFMAGAATAVNGLALANEIGSANLAAAIASSLPLPIPQGYLTTVSNTPIITSDSIAATEIYYTPFQGNWGVINNGSAFIPYQFSQLPLVLTSSQAANNLYDIFLAWNGGTPVIGTGPSWSASGGSIAAGSCARGSGSGSTAISRSSSAGLYTNTNSISLIYNTGSGNVTITVPAGQGVYLGSIYIDATAGQLSSHLSWGQSRKRGAWNAYNRQKIILQAGDSTGSWAYGSATIAPAHSLTANSFTVFSGLPEEQYDLSYQQLTSYSSGGSSVATSGIGYDVTNAFSGTTGYMSFPTSSSFAVALIAQYQPPPTIGIHTVTALLQTSGSVAMTFYGTQADMALVGKWRG